MGQLIIKFIQKKKRKNRTLEIKFSLSEQEESELIPTEVIVNDVVFKKAK